MSPVGVIDSRRQRLHSVRERVTQPIRLILPDLPQRREDNVGNLQQQPDDDRVARPVNPFSAAGCDVVARRYASPIHACHRRYVTPDEAAMERA